MIDKSVKQELLKSIKDKEEKILISSIIDKAVKFEKTNTLEFSNFLNLNELSDVKKILDYLRVDYMIFAPNQDIEKKNIAFIPDYLEDSKEKVFTDNISCIKVIPNIKNKLLHKDYMGAIYSLGVKREFIGDIIAKNDVAYFFCMKNVEKYFLLNLNSVGKQEVKLEILDIFSDEIKKLSLNFEEKTYIIHSFRVDALLSEVYNLSRSEVKEKIQKGDLYINDKNIVYPNTIIKCGDIISFRRCGKLKVGEKIRETKSLNIVIQIFKYN